MYIFCLLVSVLLAEVSATWTCNDKELPCLTNGTCISPEEWCDGEIDCPDGSDESLCNLENCPKDFFSCENRKCIPFVAFCNGYDNCGDGSDEECGSSRNVSDHSKSRLAVVEAAQYLLSQRKYDYGWDVFTPRALIALKFSEKYLPIPEKEKALMMKRLNLLLLLSLQKGIGNLATLAIHINALYALCEDPRNFHGNDLVELLRSETDKAMKSPDFNMPTVILTLCFAKEMRYRDLEELTKIYDTNDKIGVKALAIIAMSFCNRHAETPHPLLQTMSMDFIKRQNIHDRNIDVSTKALIYQAYNVLGYDTSPFHHELLRLQSESGSFGDLLGTYSVIPVLLNTSLADLQCKTRVYEGKRAKLSSVNPDPLFKTKRIEYSLWIPDRENEGYHSLRIPFEGDKSFYDLMRIAERRDPLYRFKYDEQAEIGKKVYYLAGIPSDAEKGLTWKLYKVAANIKRNSTRDKQKETSGVDRIFPQDGDNFMFQLEYAKM